MKRSDIVSNSRIAGLVQRYHTWPTLKSQSIAEHTWQVLRIWTEIFGPPPPHVTVRILTHDMGELVSGDLPFPIKKNNPELAVVTNKLEDDAVYGMMSTRSGAYALSLSTEACNPLDNLRIKICDLIEMLEFGMDEGLMGNRMAKPIVYDVGTALDDMVERLEGQDQSNANEYLDRLFGRYNKWMDSQ